MLPVCVCVCVCVYVCVYVCVCMCVCVCQPSLGLKPRGNVYTCVTETHTFKWHSAVLPACMCVRACVCVHVCMCVAEEHVLEAALRCQRVHC